MAMFNPPHPGEIIADILEDQNIGIRELARALDVAPSTVQRLVSGNATISPEMAVRLAAVLGGTRLQTAWSLEKAEREVDVSHLSTKYRPAEISPHA